MDLEDKKKFIKETLEKDLYVNRYETFKESVFLINEALKSFDINYEYTYDQFCVDFTEECLNYQENNPNIDMRDPEQMLFYTFPIVISIIEKAKIKSENK